MMNSMEFLKTQKKQIIIEAKSKKAKSIIKEAK